MKIYISIDEWYPIYTLSTYFSKYTISCEITEELYKRYIRIMAEFEELQDELEKLS